MANAYEHIETIRDYIGEGTAKHWTDRELLRRLNTVQRRLAVAVAKAPGDWLVKSKSVTPSSSEITLPSDCSKPVYLEETATGNVISFSTRVMDRRVSRLTGTSLWSGTLEAYFVKGKIVVNQDSYGEACTLWYQERVPDLHVGTASAGAATSITLSAHDGAGVSSGGFGAKVVADYYNGAGIEVVSGTGAGTVDTITDYTTARVATVSGTYDSDSVYGTISKLPEECHNLMEVEAALMAMSKPSSVLDPQIFQFIRDRWREYRNEFQEWITTQHADSHRVRITEFE